jgi:hypothetical protein
MSDRSVKWGYLLGVGAGGRCGGVEKVNEYECEKRGWAGRMTMIEALYKHTWKLNNEIH